MPTDNQPKPLRVPPPQQQPQPEEDLLAASIRDARTFFVTNWLHIIFALALVAAGVMGWHIYQLRQESKVMAAWSELGSLPANELQFMGQPEQVSQLRKEAMTATQDVVQHPAQKSAVPWALLQLGSLQADGGDWAAAAGTFTELTTKHPESEAAGAARAALATSLESLGKYKEAAVEYEALAGGEQAYFLLCAGRCRELAGETDAAKQLYTKLRGLPSKDEALDRMAAARLDDLALGQPLPPPPAMLAVSALPLPAPSMLPAVPPDTAVGQPPVPAVPAVPPAQPGNTAGENR